MSIFLALLLCLAVSAASEAELFVNQLQTLPEPGAVLPLLDAYCPPFLKVSEDTAAYLLIVINVAISYFTRLYHNCVTQSETEGPLRKEEADEFFCALWQLFIPGSIVIDHRLQDYHEASSIPTIQLVEPFRPLKQGQAVLRYPTQKGTSALTEYTLNPPPRVKASYQIHRSCTAPAQTDSGVLTFLHVFDVLPVLNQGFIKVLMQFYAFTLRDGLVRMSATQQIMPKGFVGLRNLIICTKLPGKFPEVDVNRQIRAGIIPRLNQYGYGEKIHPWATFVPLAKKIVAVIIQQRIGIIYSSAEVPTFVLALQEQIKKFCPSASVRYYLHSAPHQRLDFVVPTPDNPNLEVILDLGVSDDRRMGMETVGRYTTTSVSFPLFIPQISIKNFLDIQDLLYPNFIALKPRRFAGFSTKIYNRLRDVLPEDAPLDFRETAKEYLTLYTMNNRSLPQRVDKRFALLRIELVSAPRLKYASLTCLENTVIDVDTVIAYDRTALFKPSVPIVVSRGGDGSIWLAIARHADEHFPVSEKVVNKVPF